MDGFGGGGNGDFFFALGSIGRGLSKIWGLWGVVRFGGGEGEEGEVAW